MKVRSIVDKLVDTGRRVGQSALRECLALRLDDQLAVLRQHGGVRRSRRTSSLTAKLSILFLNKADLLREKCGEQLRNDADLTGRLKTRRLADYLRGYDGDNSFKSALSAMRKLFERLRKPKTNSALTGQTLYTHATCATDTRAVRPHSSIPI